MPAYLGRSPAAASGSRNDSVEDSVCAIRRPEPPVAVQVEGGAVLVDDVGHELHLAVTLQPSNRLAHCLLCRDIATICVGSFVRVLAEHLARLLSQFLEDGIVDEDISEPTHPVERCVEDRLQAHRAFPLTVCRSEKRGKIDAEYCPELGI